MLMITAAFAALGSPTGLETIFLIDIKHKIAGRASALTATSTSWTREVERKVMWNGELCPGETPHKKQMMETCFKGFKMILMNRKCSSWGNQFKSSFDCNAVEKIYNRDQ